MQQLFMVISFVMGVFLGAKIYEIVIAMGLSKLMEMDDSGVTYNEKENAITIEMNKLKSIRVKLPQKLDV